MLILGIESSCDETAAAVSENGTKILSSVISTQIEEHKKYGGVVPEIASRRERLAARKVPNFIRHTVSELIGLPIKGKT